ncbi:MAG TPA: hypothetical protein VGN07_22380 [Steroidobacteraceae bacterium]|jgi:hypothetical protein
MSQATAEILPAATLDEDAWDDLLSFIEERRVIPIVDAQALTDPQQHAALLQEAAILVDALPASVRVLNETRRWRNRIQQVRNDQ